MDDHRLKELKALERRLLHDRDVILQRQRRQLAASSWTEQEVRELSERQDEIEAELAMVRRKLREVERGDGQEE